MHMVSDTDEAFCAITCKMQVFVPLSLSCTLFKAQVDSTDKGVVSVLPQQS